MFRVAVIKNKEFKGFKKRGFRISSEGYLYHGLNRLNISDRRKTLYYEYNMALKRRDRLGIEIYEGDIVKDILSGAVGAIGYLQNKSAFLLIVKNGSFEIPYTFLDNKEVELEKMSTIYECGEFIHKKTISKNT